MRKLMLKLPHNYETEFDSCIDAIITSYFNADFGDSYGIFLNNAKRFWENYFNIPGPRYEYDPDISIGEGSYYDNTIFLPEILLTGKIENFADLIEVFRNLSHEYAHYYDEKTQQTFKYDEANHKIIGREPTYRELEKTLNLIIGGLALNHPEAPVKPTLAAFSDYQYALYWLSPQEEYAHHFSEIALMHFEKALEKKYKEIKKDWKISKKDKDFFTQKYMLAQNHIKQKTEQTSLKRAKCKTVIDNKDHPFPKIYNELKINLSRPINLSPAISDELGKLFKGLLHLQELDKFYDQDTINLFHDRIINYGDPILKAIILGINKETSCEQLDQFIKKCACGYDFRTEDDDLNYKLGILQLKAYFDPNYVDQKYEEERLAFVEQQDIINKAVAEIIHSAPARLTNLTLQNGLVKAEEQTGQQNKPKQDKTKFILRDGDIVIEEDDDMQLAEEDNQTPHAPDYEAAMREAASIQADIPEVYKTPDKQENLQENTQSTASPATQENLEK